MKKFVIMGFLFCTLYFSTIAQAYHAALVENQELNIKADIANSLAALRNLAINTSSIQLRASYISQLSNVTNDFNSLSASGSKSNSKKALNRLALAFMDLFNEQHKVGLDAHDDLGSNLFTDINNKTIVYDRVGASSYNRGTENISVSIDNVEQLSMSKYKLDFDIPTHYILIRQSDNQIVSSGLVTALPQHIAVDGFVININQGNIAAKDRFIISPLKNAAKSIKLAITDPQLLALAWPVMATNSNVTGRENISVTAISDINNKSFSIAHQLNPPVGIIFTTPRTYILVSEYTGSLIEGPINYNQTATNIFPTPGGYDPGYRVTLIGSPNKDDQFIIDFNLHSTADNRNGLALIYLYSQLAHYF
jgi:flagellar hook-associated protein FlgK